MIYVNYLSMLNTAKIIIHKPILKQDVRLILKPINKLESINIFTLPTRIQDKDIVAMFKGVLSLMREKIKQEQTEKFLALKLKYDRLKYLYNKAKQSN